jgi:hypothetical protein
MSVCEVSSCCHIGKYSTSGILTNGMIEATIIDGYDAKLMHLSS